MCNIFIGQDSLGEMIAYLRRQKGLSQKQLAEMLDVSAATVSNYEQNKSCPDLMTVSLLASALGVGMEVLIKGREPERGYILDS